MSKNLISFHNKKNIIFFLVICLPFVFPVSQKEIKNLYKRILSGNDDSSQKTSKICEKTSSKFSQYYKLDDKSSVGGKKGKRYVGGKKAKPKEKRSSVDEKPESNDESAKPDAQFNANSSLPGADDDLVNA